MTPQERKAQAIGLRKAGTTYKDIAQQTGYSIDWCKKELRDVVKNSSEKDAIKEAIKLALSKEGITNGQIRSLVQSVYPFQDTKEYTDLFDKATKRFVYAIKKENNTVIRPYWMHPQNAKVSLDLVMSATDNVMQSMNDSVEYIRRELNYNQSFDISIRHTIIKMLLGSKLLPEGIDAFCTRLESTMIALEERNPDSGFGECTLIPQVEYYMEKCTPKNTSAEKCISADMHTPSGLDVDAINNLLWDAYDTN